MDEHKEVGAGATYFDSGVDIILTSDFYARHK